MHLHEPRYLGVLMGCNMKPPLKLATFAAAAVVLAGLVTTSETLTPRVEVDWGNCSDDLEALKKAASEAEEEAEDAEDAAEELEGKKRDYEDCRRYPEIYDLLKDRCISKKADYEGAQSSYESAVRDVESDLDAVATRVRAVSSSCDTALPERQVPSNPGVGRTDRDDTLADRSCALYRSYKGKLPPRNIMEVCLRSNTEEHCKKCLETK